MSSIPADVPVLETPRLVLRAHRAEDLDAYAAMWADEDVVRFVAGVPLTREQAWIRLLRYRGMWSMLGFGFWIAEERGTGRLVGEAGVQEMHRALTPTLSGSLECGWMLAPEAQGKGLALEAMTAVLGWSSRAHGGLPLTCIIDLRNAASLRLAGKLGFAESARTVYHGVEVAIWRREGRTGEPAS